MKKKKRIGVAEKEMKDFDMSLEEFDSIPVDFPNDETLEAMEEARYLEEHPEELKRRKTYTSAEELINDILKDMKK